MTNFEVDAIVEIPYGSMYKYEMDKRTGQLTIDRPLPSPLPYSYGFVPKTLHADGDPTDLCLIGEHNIYPLTRVRVTLLGAFKCIDNGESDDKLVAVIKGEENSVDRPFWNVYTQSKQTLLESYKSAIKEYLSTYKEGFQVNEFVGPEEAYQILMKDIDAYQNSEE